MGKIARAFELTRQSGRVLLSDKQLLLFPVLSSAALLLVLLTFAVPLATAIDWQSLANQMQSGNRSGVVTALQHWHYAVMFAWYFVNFFVMTFFNAALMACALNKFEGKEASLGSGMKAAAERLPQILAWSAVAATVGVILQAIQERSGWIGRIVIGLVGMAWGIATFFVVPILVVERVGPFEAIKRSVEVLKKTWGETLVANLEIGIVTFLAVLAALVPAAAGITAGVLMHSIWPGVAGVPITVALLVLVSLVSTTLRGILLAATYRYAATGIVPQGFDADVLRQAFTPKKT